jgi:CheY-like chemotaxis protein
MGGRIGVDSTPGQGSRFWFTVRLQAAESSANQAPAAVEHHALPDALAQLRHQHAGTRMLVAEDNLVNQEVARQLLLLAGLEVDLADDGEQALRMLAERPYALVLMDVQMPGMDGLQATRAIRDQPRWDGLPIVAMTANALGEDRDMCLQAGMNDHVGKPVNPNRLYATLLHWLGQQTAGQDAG